MENENKLNPQLPYRGPSKLRAAFENTLASTLIATIGGSAVYALGIKLFKKTPFTTKFSELIRSTVMWGAGLGVGLAGSYSAYKDAGENEKQYNQLLADNIEMRSQLNQTGQILRHVAGEVEKGHLKDSELTVNEDAPPSHVAKLEAQKAANEVQAAFAKA